ncbi:MAG TPA: XRE family transcriptional regulator [Phycisphaerae bacterium]|nr:XRE family transcriptional regulator [Phycisphaerae bacterium]
MFELENTDPRLLGGRLTAARKARGVTQEEAAAHLECSRPTYIAIEKGDRRAKPGEIVRLAAFYGRSLHELVRPGLEPVSLEPHLRAVVDQNMASADEINVAISGLERFAADYRELERLLNAKPISAYPPLVSLPRRGNLADFAEDVAMRERDRLDLGSQPILNLRQALEADVGLRVFYGDLPSRIAGMFAFTAELGFCVYINRKHPPERRRATLSHEYGHALCDRHKPGIDYLDGPRRKPASERFAEAFGLSFLMPASGVRRKFYEIADSMGDFQVADLCRLSNFYFVSVQAMTLRLEELGLIGRGIWELLSEKGFKPRKAAQELGLNPRFPESDEPYPQRYKFLAVQAYRMSKISEGQLGKFLRCDPVTAREIVASCLNQSIVDANGEILDARMPFEESLLRSQP